MHGADLVFWYTGGGVWAIIALLLAAAVLLGLMAGCTQAWNYTRTIWWSWVVIAALKDMDLDDDDIRNAWYEEFSGDRAAYDAMMPRLRNVQAYLRKRARCTVAPRTPHRVIKCPECGMHHVDAGEWAAKPHRTHLCEHCCHAWKPYSYRTIGVRDEYAPHGRDKDGEPIRAPGPVSAATVVAERNGDAAP